MLVYIGYTDDMLYKQRIEREEPCSIPIAIPGNVRSMMGGRIAYLLNLHGPSIVIDTACSSSLVAVHMACGAIQRGDCEMAIVGSTKIFLDPLYTDSQFLYGVMSADDKTRSYDAGADGFGIGEGTGAIILKAFDNAIVDNDNIYAVIKGSAITQDGTSTGITAPNIKAQEEVIRRAWRISGIGPDEIDYVEGHGTATALGDAIELQALGNILKEFGATRKCILGSVKSNIGHLDHAAGIAGLIKLLLMLKNKKIPPTAHFQEPNILIDTERLPIQINKEVLEWKSENKERTCGISSFGISGTNCHVVLKEYHSTLNNRKKMFGNLFTLSAKTKVALRNLAQSYIVFLKNAYDLSIDDICYTANVGREQYHFRLAIPCTDKEDLICSIEKILSSDYIDKMEATGTVVDKKIQGACNDLVLCWKNGYRKEIGLLPKIGKLYCMGADIPWYAFYDGKLQHVSLPVYPFSKTRCWYKATSSSLYHELIWEQQKIPEQRKQIHTEDKIVIIGPRCEFLEHLTSVIKEEKEFVTLLEYENQNTEKKYSYEQVFQNFIESVNWKQVTHIIFCLPSIINKNVIDKNIGERLDKGVFFLFRLIKKLLNYSRKRFQFILIGNNTYNICKNENELYPENAASYGMGRVVNLEYPHIICRCLDISVDTDVKDVSHEIFEGDINTFLVALRGKHRYVQIMHCKDECEETHRVVEIKKDGVYVITGGTGELGLRISQLISECQEVQLVLISREPLPPREDWINNSISLPEKNRSCIDLIQRIEKRHTKVSLYSADVSNEVEITHTIDAIIKKFGKIDGIVHCAGVPGNGFIVNKEESLFRKVLAPKVEGTWLIHTLTKQYCPDFFILFSSVTAITGAPGQSDYCAANSFLNAFSEYRNLLGYPTLCITWAKWEGIGMGTDFEIDYSKELFCPIDAESALNAYKHIWNLSSSNIIVGEVNSRFYSKRDENIRINRTQNNPEEKSDFISLRRPNIDAGIILNGKSSEYTYYERMIATIWKDVLGYDKFCVHDSFFDIGGDSLKIRSVYAQIEELFPGKITIVDLFTYSTIFQLAKFDLGVKSIHLP